MRHTTDLQFVWDYERTWTAPSQLGVQYEWTIQVDSDMRFSVNFSDRDMCREATFETGAEALTFANSREKEMRIARRIA